MTAKKKTTTKPKPKPAPKKLPAGNIKISGELNKRLTSVADKSGVAKNKLSELLLNDIVGRLEAGGKLTINLSDGSIHIQAAAPQLPAGAIPPAPVQRGRQMTENAGPRRVSFE